jgi:hypothetical protein
LTISPSISSADDGTGVDITTTVLGVRWCRSQAVGDAERARRRWVHRLMRSKDALTRRRRGGTLAYPSG